MKNASKHESTLKALLKKLTKQYAAEAREPIDPIKALVRGILSYDASDARVDDAIAAIEKEYVDLNELRVATELEVQALLGERYPKIEERTSMISQALNDVFDREHTLNFERLKTISKKDVRAFLKELPAIHPFAEAYCFVMGFDGAAMPLDDDMLGVLVDADAVEGEATLAEAQKFVESHVKGEELYPAFVALRGAASESRKKKKVKA